MQRAIDRRNMTMQVVAVFYSGLRPFKSRVLMGFKWYAYTNYWDY